ncbi:MAG TPA: aspartate carbamoyltransferase catalytic subunit [Ktedonobacterales bacterium]|nr:aspartate carbamoyltransferase catalytic subunit [Ktedonobacterales bacterium]
MLIEPTLLGQALTRTDVWPATNTDAPPAPVDFARRHLLDVDDFSAAELRAVIRLAYDMRDRLAPPTTKLPTLRGRTVVNLFYENSTRTRVSFELAAKHLGADVVNITASGSSVAKGESLLDTVRTLQALGAEVVVMRHGQSGAPDLVARHLDGIVVNAGDGWHAHPSQALLDLFTMHEALGELAGKRVAIVGDILHSRVARSNLWALTALGAEVVLCGPPTLVPPQLAALAAARPSPDGRARRARVEPCLERALAGADVVMALRLQRERQAAGLLPSLGEYRAHFGLSAERMALARPGALVMHPGPMNEGVEIDPEVAHGAASVIERQVTNGVAVRMAILTLLARARAW